MFELLFNAGVNSENIQDKEGNNTLLMATRLGLTKVVKNLLNNGANINERNNNKSTALISASHKNNKELVKILLEYKPNFNTLNNKGWSALKIACRKHQTKEIVELLINAGADINQISKINDKIENVTPLKVARWNQYENINSIEEFLKSKGGIVI